LWTCLLAFRYRWESNTEDRTDPVHVNHNVTTFKMGYELLYVARVGTPDYDERFIGYGWTRNTQLHYFYVSFCHALKSSQQPSYGITFVPSFAKFYQFGSKV
jgi:hypothetical protein